MTPTERRTRGSRKQMIADLMKSKRLLFIAGFAVIASSVILPPLVGFRTYVGLLAIAFPIAAFLSLVAFGRTLLAIRHDALQARRAIKATQQRLYEIANQIKSLHETPSQLQEILSTLRLLEYQESQGDSKTHSSFQRDLIPAYSPPRGANNEDPGRAAADRASDPATSNKLHALLTADPDPSRQVVLAICSTALTASLSERFIVMPLRPDTLSDHQLRRACAIVIDSRAFAFGMWHALSEQTGVHTARALCRFLEQAKKAAVPAYYLRGNTHSPFDSDLQARTHTACRNGFVSLQVDGPLTLLEGRLLSWIQGNAHD